MKNPPSLSIITINFNNASGLQKTIESVVGQIFSDFEFIIIDGSSSDGSVDVIKKYADKITYWVSEKDNGIYHAMNKGIVKAEGEYCLFLNSGDYLFNIDTLEQVSNFKLNSEIVYGNLIFASKSEMQLSIPPEKIGVIYLIRGSMFHPATFIKRKLFSDIGWYDESFRIAGDYDFFVKAFIQHKVSCSYIPLTISVFDTEGISNNITHKKTEIEERSIVQKKYFNEQQLHDAAMYSKLIMGIPYRFLHLLERKIGFTNLTKKVFNINYY